MYSIMIIRDDDVSLDEIDLATLNVTEVSEPCFGVIGCVGDTLYIEHPCYTYGTCLAYLDTFTKIYPTQIDQDPILVEYRVVDGVLTETHSGVTVDEDEEEVKQITDNHNTSDLYTQVYWEDIPIPRGYR